MVGLDVGSTAVKAVQLSTKGRGDDFELTHLGVAQLPPDAIVQGAFLNSSAIVDTIREAIDAGKIKNRNVAAAVSGHSVIVKKIRLAAMTREELENQIQWEAEQYIPFDVNEVNLDFQILGTDESSGEMDVVLVAAKKDLIDDYVQVITEAGLKPVAIDVAAFAVENAFERNYETEADEMVALVNVGAQVVNIIVFSQGVPLFTRDIAAAGNQYTEEIQKTLSVGFQEAERIKLGGGTGDDDRQMVPAEVERAMQSVTEMLVGEIGRSLDFFATTIAESRIKRALICGGGANVSGFLRAFQEHTGIEAQVLDPLHRMRPNSSFDSEFLEEMSPSLGVGVGLALRRIEI
ncbi:pilus assembly protein PilM [Myxococcota bacterium]|nr:pilus assembly protein PilM [Myxococcota bacterium]